MSELRKASDAADFSLSSAAFRDGGVIPRDYTCDGRDISPPLLVANVPRAAKSLALIMEDPDSMAGNWIHWTLWNIDSHVDTIEENELPKNTVTGVNDFGKHGYGGPCPKEGTHRYYFRLYAIDSALDLQPHLTQAHTLREAMGSHIIAETELMGRYRRRPPPRRRAR